MRYMGYKVGHSWFKTNRRRYLQLCVIKLSIWGCWYCERFLEMIPWAHHAHCASSKCWKLQNTPRKLQTYPNPNGSLDLWALALETAFFHPWLLRWQGSFSIHAQGWEIPPKSLLLAGVQADWQGWCGKSVLGIWCRHSTWSCSAACSTLRTWREKLGLTSWSVNAAFNIIKKPFVSLLINVFNNTPSLFFF